MPDTQFELFEAPSNVNNTEQTLTLPVLKTNDPNLDHHDLTVS